MPNACKVISTYFGNRLHRTQRQWPMHSQAAANAEDSLSVFKDCLEFEHSVDAGVDYDTIIVNNDNGFGKGNEYVNSLDGTPTKRGVIKTITRPNHGKNFAAFNEAFKTYRDQYNYWFFTPDDHVYVAKDWYKVTIEKLESDPDIGVVGPIGIGHLDKEIGKAPHCHDGIACSDRRKIDMVIEKFGDLAHCPPEINGFNNRGKTGHIMMGEIPFTNNFEKVGLKVVPVFDKYGLNVVYGSQEFMPDGWPILYNDEIYAIPLYSLTHNEFNCRRFLKS